MPGVTRLRLHFNVHVHLQQEPQRNFIRIHVHDEENCVQGTQLLAGIPEPFPAGPASRQVFLLHTILTPSPD